MDSDREAAAARAADTTKAHAQSLEESEAQLKAANYKAKTEMEELVCVIDRSDFQQVFEVLNFLFYKKYSWLFALATPRRRVHMPQPLCVHH